LLGPGDLLHLMRRRVRRLVNGLITVLPHGSADVGLRNRCDRPDGCGHQLLADSRYR
jgi:hypothetical protein